MEAQKEGGFVIGAPTIDRKLQRAFVFITGKKGNAGPVATKRSCGTGCQKEAKGWWEDTRRHTVTSLPISVSKYPCPETVTVRGRNVWKQRGATNFKPISRTTKKRGDELEDGLKCVAEQRCFPQEKCLHRPSRGCGNKRVGGSVSPCARQKDRRLGRSQKRSGLRDKEAWSGGLLKAQTGISVGAMLGDKITEKSVPNHNSIL